MREESGWLMVEIMVGAVALIITGLAIYSGLDRASRAAGQNRNRSAAAFLAQQDQERLRAKDITALKPLVAAAETRTVTVNSSPLQRYVVTSRAYNANDTNGTSTACTSASTTASYFRITSTVTDPTGKNGPVTLESLVAPRGDQSGAALQIVDRTGTTGVPGVSVTVDQNASLNDTTDSNGCVQFGFLNGTLWTVGFSKTGYVTPDGIAAPSAKPLTVVTGQSSLTRYQYDQAGAIGVQFQDNLNGTAKAYGLTVRQTGMTPSTQKFDFGATPLTSYTSAKTWFPFYNVGTSSPDPYLVWAGNCLDASSNSPTQPTTPYSVPVTPGDPGTPLVTVRMPLATVTVTKSTGGNYGANAEVWVTDACGEDYVATTDINSQAKIPVPFGSLSFCADDRIGNSTLGTTHKGTAGSISNTTTGVTRTVQLNMGTAGGQCS